MVSVGVCAQVALLGMLCLDMSADRGVLAPGGDAAVTASYYRAVAGPLVQGLRTALFGVSLVDMLRTAGVYHHMMPGFSAFGVWAWLALQKVPAHLAAAFDLEDGSPEQLEELRSAAALNVPAVWLAVASWTLVAYSQARGKFRPEYAIVSLLLGMATQGLVLGSQALAAGASEADLAGALTNYTAHYDTFVGRYLFMFPMLALFALLMRRLGAETRSALDLVSMLLALASYVVNTVVLTPATNALAFADATMVPVILPNVRLGSAASVLAYLVLLVAFARADAFDEAEAKRAAGKKGKKKRN